jgi:hypothetical protein
VPSKFLCFVFFLFVLNELHRLTIHLENYNPSNVGNQLPSFPGNNWALKLTTGLNAEVFREYYDAGNGGSNFPCTSNGTLPLSVLTGGASQPFQNAFVVPVLPFSTVGVRVLENYQISCPSAAGPYVDCHPTAYGVGVLFDNNCRDGLCDSGVCVNKLEIPAICDWNSSK